MRLLWLLITVALAGCAGSKKADAPDPAPVPVEDSTATFGNKQDKADQRIAASIQGAREANADGKPAAVEAELSVAASYLPLVLPGDLAFVRQRIQQNDPKAYAEAKAYGAKLKADLDDLWVKMETQQKQSAAEITELKRQIDNHKAAIEEARKDKIAQQLSTMGAGLIALGVALLAFGSFIGVSKLSAGLVILGGILTSSLTWVMDSPAFSWLIIGICALVGLAALQGLVAVSIKGWRYLFPAAKVEAPENQPTDPANPPE
jgi:hypothetical protein